LSKPFDTKLYEEDDNAKQTIKDWLTLKGYSVWVNPDDYGIDLIGEKNGRKLGWEVEVKHNWRGKRFPFTSVHISARKKKFCEPNHHFIMLNHERTIFLTVSAPDFVTCKVVTKDTIYTEKEQFVEIPLSKCRFIELN